MTWVVLPGAYAPASIAFRVIGAHKPPLHDKSVVLEEDVLGVNKDGNTLKELTLATLNVLAFVYTL
jgi:hypothetical protein